MYPLLFRIPTDGYTEGGYNPTCITKTDGLLPLGVCDSGSDEDVQGSARDFYGNQVDAGVFLDAVAFKLERCRLGMCGRKEKNPFVHLIEIHSGPFFLGTRPSPREGKKFPKNSSCTVIFMIISHFLPQGGAAGAITFFKPPFFFNRFPLFFP